MQLSDSVKYIKGVGPKKAEALGKLGINTVYELLTYYPRTYEDQSVLTSISELKPGEQATVESPSIIFQRISRSIIPKLNSSNSIF